MRYSRILGSTLVLLFLWSQGACAQVNPSTVSIEQAIQIAVQHNHDLRITALAIANAKAAGVAADAAPNPILTVQSFNINPAAGIGSGNLRSKTVDSSVRVDQLFERGAKRALRKETADHLETAAGNDMQDALRQIRAAVSAAYYDVLAGQERIAILNQTSRSYGQTISAAQKRQKAGDIALADVARLQIDALRADNDTAQAATDLSKARQALALMLGTLSRASELSLTDSWPTLRFEALIEPERALEHRADVLAAQQRLAAAIAARKLALAARTRDVTIGVQFEHYPTSASNSQGSGNSLGVALQVPLFVRYGFEGEIGMAQAALDTAQENLDKTRELARSDVNNSWADARVAYERVTRFDESLLPAAKKSSDAAELAFQHGAMSIMDVLDVRRTYRATLLDALAARADYAKSLAAWQAAVSESITP